jgi:hypothetical protein
MTPEESLIDNYVTTSGVMLAGLGDHLMTLDELRDSHKHASLDHFGLTADPAAYKGNLQRVVSSHVARFDTDMGAYLRYAHVVLTYMVLEDRLHAFGQLISAMRRGAAFVSSKGKGSLLDRFERYLSALSFAGPSKDRVEALRLVRNCVVHCRGCVPDFSERHKLRQYLPTLIGVMIDAQERLGLTTEGCLRLQEGAIQYLHAIDCAAGFHLCIPPEVRRNFEEHILPHLADATDGT